MGKEFSNRPSRSSSQGEDAESRRFGLAKQLTRPNDAKASSRASGDEGETSAQEIAVSPLENYESYFSRRF
ncbi:MAG: hypothetical protein AAB588_00110 [Patescibacteria group bacterium]